MDSIAVGIIGNGSLLYPSCDVQKTHFFGDKSSHFLGEDKTVSRLRVPTGGTQSCNLLMGI